VLDELDARGFAGNTVIIVIGDNGYYMGERGFAGKWSHYDESLRVPCVVYDPRLPTGRRGRVGETIALNIDIAPTILAVAGVPPDARMQGQVLDAIVESDSSTDRRGFYCEHRMRHPSIPRWEGYRTPRYKYARYLDAFEDGEHLYDLGVDPDELHNLASDDEHAEQLELMRAETTRLSRRYRDEGAPLPRILLLGDSISMGYHDTVVRALDDVALVVRPRENCAGTTKGLEKIDQWLRIDGGDFDVIHFNFGLHDLKRVTATGRNSHDPADGRQAELDQYERNLRALVTTLRATGATLVFATTTPVPTGGVRPHRDPEDVARYNAAALKIMVEHDIAITDLYTFASARLDRIQQPLNVHFTKEGSRELGLEVARSLREALRKKRGRESFLLPNPS
jgi:hypothetical protein